ncbi:hypothetical protein D9M69_592190 [compost metagenome]
MGAFRDIQVEAWEHIEELAELRAAFRDLVVHAVAEGFELQRGESRRGLGPVEHRHAAALQRGDGLGVVARIVGLLRAFERGACHLLAQAFGLL